MAGNYPPGTSAGDPNAPWNAPEAPECRECEHVIHEEGDHADGCPNASMDAVDMRKAEAERGRRDWDDVKEDPTPAEQERYGLEAPPSERDDDADQDQ